MKKLSFAIFFTLLSFSYSHCQIRFGIKGGINLADVALKYKGLTNYDGTRLRIAPNASVFVDIGINKFISIQPSLMLTGKGYKMTDPGETKSFNVYDLLDTTSFYNYFLNYSFSKYAPLYIEIPILALVRLPLGEIKTYFGLGPYIAYGIGGNYRKTGYNSDTKLWSYGVSDLAFKNLDAGVSFAGGIEIDRFILGVQYDLGMTNYLKPDAGLPKLSDLLVNGSINSAKIFNKGDFYKNRVFSFSIGYAIFGSLEPKKNTHKRYQRRIKIR